MPLNLPTHKPADTDKKGNLYVVATPIGNMEDITVRALKILDQVDIIAAEDTRHTGKLLSFYKIKKPLISCHEYNERGKTPSLINKLSSGLCIALVSNAGTPTMSDPGYQLIKEALKENIRVVPIPGPCAFVTGLSASGMPTDSFIFIGFPARKKAKRLNELRELAVEQRTIVFYESPRRIKTLLGEIILNMGNRKGVLCREMTKMHEEFINGRMSDIISSLEKRPSIKGECTLIVDRDENAGEISMEELRKEIKKNLTTSTQGLSGFAKDMARKYNFSRKTIYEEALKVKELAGS